MKDITIQSNLKALGGVGVPGNLDVKKIGVEEEEKKEGEEGSKSLILRFNFTVYMIIYCLYG